MSWWLELTTAALLVPAATAAGRVLLRAPLLAPEACRHWLTCASAATGATLCGRSWWWAAGYGLSSLVALILWWWSRRKRDRAPRSYGAKSRARIEALIRFMPRWSPGQQPQGARA